jgi:hypothetical protein
MWGHVLSVVAFIMSLSVVLAKVVRSDFRVGSFPGLAVRAMSVEVSIADVGGPSSWHPFGLSHINDSAQGD